MNETIPTDEQRIANGEVCLGCDRPLLPDGNCPDAGNCPVGARLKSLSEAIRRSGVGDGRSGTAKSKLPSSNSELSSAREKDRAARQMNENRRVLPPGDRE